MTKMALKVSLAERESDLTLSLLLDCLGYVTVLHIHYS